MTGRAKQAIELRASNYSGGHYFMSLITGSLLSSYNWKRLPIHEGVIKQVEQLSIKQHQNIILNKGIMFDHEEEEEEEDINSFN